MKKIVIDLDNVQSVVNLTPDEIAELEQLAIVPVIPRTIDKRRLMMALYALDKLESLEAAIASVGPVATMQWKYTTIFHEDSQLVQSLIQGLGWNAATVDSIFNTAYSLT